MTWPWRTCSDNRFLTVAALFFVAMPLAAGTVAGSVQLVDSRDPSVSKRKNYSGVVVWLEPPNHASTPTRAAKRVEMTQKGKRFIPHVLAVPVGATVEFPNLDLIFHNAFSNFSGMPFDVGLYPPGQSRSVTFTRDGIVRVFCNIHPTMSAIIAVLKSPWYAVTGSSGDFEIADVPAGEYLLRVFHERTVPQGLRALQHKVIVPGGRSVLAPLKISETGYLPAPHKNKYGQEYPPVMDDSPLYPGGKK